jgi:hypothetical protein
MVSNPSPTSKVNNTVNRRKQSRRSTGRYGDDDAGSASSLSSAASDNDDTSDTDAFRSSLPKRLNGQIDLCKVTLDKYHIHSSATDEEGSHNASSRKPKSLPLNLPCKKKWMRNYLKEAENAMVAGKKAEEEAAAKMKKEPTPEVTPADIMQEDGQDYELMVDIVDDKKDISEPPLPSPPHHETKEQLPEPTAILEEHDIFSDNESTASTVPADDLDQSLLSTDPIADYTTTETNVVEAEVDTSTKEAVVANTEHNAVANLSATESAPEATDHITATEEETTVAATEIAPPVNTTASSDPTIHNIGQEAEQESHIQSVASASEADQESQPQATETDPNSLAQAASTSNEADQESQPQAPAPKVVRLSVKEYLSQRAAAAHRDESASEEKTSASEESNVVAEGP